MKIYPFRGLPSLANTMKLLHTNFRHHPSIIEEMVRNAPKQLGMNSLTLGSEEKGEENASFGDISRVCEAYMLAYLYMQACMLHIRVKCLQNLTSIQKSF